MWASSHSSAGRRLRRNTEDGHKLKLDMAHRAASSPAGEGEREKHVKVIKLHSRTDVFWYFDSPTNMSGIIMTVYSLDR